jgi:hypothetical protein
LYELPGRLTWQDIKLAQYVDLGSRHCNTSMLISNLFQGVDSTASYSLFFNFSCNIMLNEQVLSVKKAFEDWQWCSSSLPACQHEFAQNFFEKRLATTCSFELCNSWKCAHQKERMNKNFKARANSLAFFKSFL